MTYKYQFYDAATHTCICPVNRHYKTEEDQKLMFTQLEQLGASVLCQIEMPFDAGFDYYHVQLPAWLKYQQDDEDDGTMWEFFDEKGRMRIRIHNSLVPGITIFTRYWPSDYIRDTDGLKPCVYDIDIPPDEFDEDNEKQLIWQGENKERLALREIRKPAEEWLDQNYPDWRNPMAYWS